MNLRNKYLIFLIVFGGKLFSQEVLPLDEAIKIALDKNYSVRMARNNFEIARAQNNAGNAGMSPTISVNAGLSSANLNSYQVFNNGTDQNRPGAVNYGATASLNADWIVFDGMRMFAIKKRLKLNEQASELQQKVQMENVIYDVISAYYGMVRNNELMKAAQKNLKLYEERRKISELRLEIGSDSKVELLLSKSDENRARTAISQLELDILNARVNLNLLLGRNVDVDFRIADTIILNYEPAFDELKKNLPSTNKTLLVAKQNELIADQSIREARALGMPFVTFNGAYQYSRNQSQAGFVYLSRQTGLTGALSARWVIFNGNRTNRLVKERNLLALNQRLFTEQSRYQVDALAFVSYQRLLMNKKIAQMELQNLKDANELQYISLERYRVGKSGILETIETQNNLEAVQVRYIDALYNSKLAEADLLRVNGQLVK